LESGVHGAVLVLNSSLTADMLANLLAIPVSKSYVRRHLSTEYDVIVLPARCAHAPFPTTAAENVDFL